MTSGLKQIHQGGGGGGGPDFYFNHQHISQSALRPSLEKQLDLGSNCFSIGVGTSISEEIYSNLWFSKGGDQDISRHFPLDQPMNEQVSYCVHF